MKKSDLIEKLTIVSPGLASADIVPLMSHYWFTGNKLLTFNDKISIAVPCKVPGFKGAVPGQLLSLLSSTTGKDEVELTPTNNELKVKTGRTNVKFATIPAENFFFDIEKYKPTGKTLGVDFAKFTARIECLLRSCLPDTPVGEMMGISLEMSGDRLCMYSYNKVTISAAHLPIKGKGPSKRAILPSSFCKEMVKFSKAEGAAFELYDNHAIFSTAGGVWLFTRLLQANPALDFEKSLKYHLPKDMKSLLPLPDKLGSILERACIVTEENAGNMVSTIKSDGGKIRFHSKSGHIEVTDLLTVANHPDLEPAIFEPKLLKDGVADFDKFLLTPSCCIMQKADLGMYLVTSRTAAS